MSYFTTLHILNKSKPTVISKFNGNGPLLYYSKSKEKKKKKKGDIGWGKLKKKKKNLRTFFFTLLFIQLKSTIIMFPEGNRCLCLVFF